MAAAATATAASVPGADGGAGLLALRCGFNWAAGVRKAVVSDCACDNEPGGPLNALAPMVSGKAASVSAQASAWAGWGTAPRGSLGSTEAVVFGSVVACLPVTPALRRLLAPLTGRVDRAVGPNSAAVLVTGRTRARVATA